MIRRLAFLAALASMLVVPTLATAWTHYTDPRLGYAIDIPPGFQRSPPAAGGTAIFTIPTAKLSVRGGPSGQDGFEAEAGRVRQAASDEGWAIASQLTTPGYARFSARRGGRLLEARLIALCRGSRFAAFALEYSRVDVVALRPAIERLVRSFVATGTGCAGAANGSGR